MSNNKTNCFICEGQLIYPGESKKKECSICKEEHMTEGMCENGHYVCDKCHGEDAMGIIMEYCKSTNSTNPLDMIQELMRYPQIKMHGPEHHYLIPAVLLTAYMNITESEEDEKKEKLKIARQRAKNVLGGFCGFYGSCGAGVGTGIYISVLTEATPLTTETWTWANKMTSKSLSAIADAGGPRCCKRNTFLATIEAIKYTKKITDVLLIDYENVDIKCMYSHLNKECQEKQCKFYNK